MGAMLKSSGLAGQQIVDVSTDLAGLAADMASFYNLDFDEAFSKIRSGISGMTMPLKELGIDMSVDTLNAFALAQGLDKTFDKMTQGEQTMLRYQYLMQATSDAQGDFARTSDGYANSLRKLETNIEGIKTKLGSTFLGIVADATSALNGFLESIYNDTGKRTVLDDFADIDKKTEAKLADIARIRKEADDLVTVLDKIYGNGEEGDDGEKGKKAAEIISEYGVKSEEATSFLEGLGFTTDEINKKQGEWLETCKRLVKVIPGLSSLINTETGEIKGGKTAVEEYINAWEEGQKKIALLSAQESRRQALAAKYAELPGLEVDKILAESRVKKAYSQLQDIADKYGVDLNWYGGNLSYFDEGAKRKFGINQEQYDILKKEVDYYLQLKKEADKATDAYTMQYNAYEKGMKVLEEGDKIIEETYGDAKDLLTEEQLFWENNAENAKTATDTAKAALVAMREYADTVRDGVAKSVDATIKGFEKIETPAQKAKKKIEDLKKQIADPKNKKDIDNLKKQLTLAETGGDLVSAQSMGANLKQQAEYMETYLANLRKARSLGVSAEVLAELSDGSEESYDYLEALANASPEEVKTINDSFQSVIDKKKELTNELTGQQLTVDQTYKNLAAKAKEAVAALDLQDEAAKNTGATIEGIAKGIADHVDSVKEQVDAIIKELDRLNGYGISVDFGGFGNITFTTSTGKTEGSGRMGIPLVPHDDYIARLHEGERVLTAQENQVYSMLLHGGIAGFSLDDLGGVMRDNVKAGGNVYLDGKIVGNVVSDYQGRSYKSMQRSGWQT
jgi:hypothetical protein